MRKLTPKELLISRTLLLSVFGATVFFVSSIGIMVLIYILESAWLSLLAVWVLMLPFSFGFCYKVEDL